EEEGLRLVPLARNDLAPVLLGKGDELDFALERRDVSAREGPEERRALQVEDERLLLVARVDRLLEGLFLAVELLEETRVEEGDVAGSIRAEARQRGDVRECARLSEPVS